MRLVARLGSVVLVGRTVVVEEEQVEVTVGPRVRAWRLGVLPWGTGIDRWLSSGGLVRMLDERVFLSCCRLECRNTRHRY